MEKLDVVSSTASDKLHLQLTTLPPELKCAIFVNLPDLASAKSLALVSSSFYHTFLDAESIILKQILQNEITTDLLYGAVAAHEASKIPLWTKEAVQDFLIKYFRRSPLHTSYRWDLSDALLMSKIHACVEFFAAEFASSALSHNPTARGSNAPPSYTEMIRIKRNLYRFELYCNLFRKPGYDRMRRGERNCLIQPSPFREQEVRNIFFDNFSPWENEQLGCIHDYFIEEITPSFTDVAKHDVDWGEMSVPWIDTFDTTALFWKKGYLLKGLDFVFQLSTAYTYDDRHRLYWSNRRSSGSFLSDALGPLRELSDQGVMLKDYDDEEEKRIIKRSFDDDNDSGPEEAWRWAHNTKTKNRFYFLANHQPLRQRGYVMWDLQRLVNWGILNKSVAKMIVRRSPASYNEADETAEEREQDESWEERSRIWGEGGRGWWAPGDESHIEWPRK